MGELVVSVSDTHPMSKDRLIFLNTSDIYGGKLLHKDYTQVAYWPGQAKKSVALNDILFSEIRPANGRWALIKEPAEDIVVSTKLMVIRADPAKLLAEFLYLFVTSDNITGWLQHLAESRSGTFPQITFDQVASLQIPLPPLPEQRRIAHILGTLDDKIENNRKTAKTLEAMAQAIFKSWFVDFDPVRAKMAGESRENICKRLKLTPEILDLFPDRLVDSELGEIPEGWGVGPLGSILNLRKEHCNTSEATIGRPYVPIECISSKSLFLTESKSGLEAQSSLTKFNKDDILFGAMRPYFHKVCIAPFDGTTRTTAFVLYPKNERDLAFGIFVMFNKDTIDYATANSTGSTIPYAVWDKSLENMSLIIPDEDIRAAFTGAISTLLNYATGISCYQLTQLKAIRDTLLPKLISGEICVPEAKHLIEEAEE